MRIIIIGPAHPYRGGIADTNEALCRALVRAGHDASIITFTVQYPSILFPGKTQYTNDPFPSGLKIRRMVNSLNPLSWLRTAKAIKKQKTELVIVRYWIPFLSPALGSIARLVRKNTKVIALCDNIVPHEKRPGDKVLTNYFTSACHSFVTMSNTVKDELSDFTNRPIQYLPHPINDTLGEELPPTEARKHLGLDPEGKYLLFFGLVRKYKGLDLMLQAMTDERIRSLGIVLMVIGEFYDGEEEYRRFIRENKLEANVFIHNEFIPTADMKYYFSASDMVTQTYHTASQSGVTQVAYNFNKPMLVTRVGGLKEIVPHEVVGYATAKEPQAIADAIIDFYKNDKAEKFVANIKVEKKKYSWDTFVSSMLEFGA